MIDPARPLWIFLHAPKCGGTTLKAHLERHFTMDEQLVEFSHWGNSYRKRHGRPEFADRPPEQRALPQSHPHSHEVVKRKLVLDDDLRTLIYADSRYDLELVEWVRANRWPR